MSQPASFDQPRPGETVLSCRHINAKSGRQQFFVGDRDKQGTPTGLGTWVKTRDDPEGFYVRWVSLCSRCAAELKRKRETQPARTPIQMASLAVIWQRKETP
jgi:hypothetical protein